MRFTEMLTEQSMEAGRKLRREISTWTEKTGKSNRELSRLIGCESLNYISGYMNTDPRKWALPGGLRYAELLRVLNEPVDD